MRASKAISSVYSMARGVGRTTETTERARYVLDEQPKTKG